MISFHHELAARFYAKYTSWRAFFEAMSPIATPGYRILSM